MLVFQVRNMHLSYVITEVTLIGLLDGFWLRCLFLRFLHILLVCTFTALCTSRKTSVFIHTHTHTLLCIYNLYYHVKPGTLVCEPLDTFCFHFDPIIFIFSKKLIYIRMLGMRIRPLPGQFLFLSFSHSKSPMCSSFNPLHTVFGIASRF